MDFKELQNKIIENAINYGKKYNVQIDEDFALLKIIRGGWRTCSGSFNPPEKD
jgi:hypothetical protein